MPTGEITQGNFLPLDSALLGGMSPAQVEGRLASLFAWKVGDLYEKSPGPSRPVTLTHTVLGAED